MKLILILAALIQSQRDAKKVARTALSICGCGKGKFLLLTSALMAWLPMTTVAAGGLFPKMPWATNVFVLNCPDESEGENDDEGMRMARALQGLVNQSSAEVYIIRGGHQLSQLEQCGKPFEKLEILPGTNSALRTLFRKYKGNVRKMFLFDQHQDWTWHLALMASAQQQGIPVTESVSRDLTKEFGWKGEVEDFRNRWTNRITAYDWALAHLMPGCNKQVVFTPRLKHALFDYIVASKGFTFWLDFKSERVEVDKIFSTPGYSVGTSLMGYASTGDGGNFLANPHGIGYVVSGRFANGSFWSSFPNKTFSQPPRQPRGQARKAEPGKIYISLGWSEGDNIAFNQASIYRLWQDPKRGTFPMATALNPVLQEIDPPLLDWYYSNLTTNDELYCGATGFQFIGTGRYKDDLFPAWCQLNRNWGADAGFGSVHIWMTAKPDPKFVTYMTTCGWPGVFGKAELSKPGYSPMINWQRATSEKHLVQVLNNELSPNPKAPVFVHLLLTTEAFVKAGGYSAVKWCTDQPQTAHPNRFVFLLPRDQFATMQAWYNRKSER